MSNFFWAERGRDRWSADRDDKVHLGRAVCLLGSALFAEKWQADDFVHLGAPFPVRPEYDRDADRVIDLQKRIKFLPKHYAYVRAENAYQSNLRAVEVADHFLAAAETGKLNLVSRPIRGGTFVDVPSDCWDRRRSLHVFGSCTFSLQQPFTPNPPIGERHELFVDRISLNGFLRTIPGGVLTRVSDAALEDWVRENTTLASNQGELIALSKTAFQNKAAPARDRLVEMDKKVREACNLPARTRGKPSGR